MKDLLVSVRLVLLSLFACCVLYTAAILAFAQVFVPWKADGSMVTDKNGRILGSSLIAQKFTGPGYFWPRPSAVDYNATATGGSNLSPTNPKLAERARGTLDLHDLTGGRRVPADLVAASGSGMDPHISLAAARFQIPRVAAARGLAQSQVERVVERAADRVLGGDPVVNVLELNLAVDGLAGG
jgi:K+-transporting ATPase ATPase C chain